MTRNVTTALLLLEKQSKHSFSILMQLILRFCAGLNPARSVSEIRDGGDL